MIKKFNNVRASQNKFLALCIDMFGEINGHIVYAFYDTCLYALKGKGYGSQIDKKYIHVTASLKKCTREQFLDMIFQIKENYETNPLRTKYTSTYLDKYIENLINPNYERKKSKYISTNIIKKSASAPLPVKAKIIIKPKQHERITDRFDDDWKNWNYECTCGAIYSCTTYTCPQCGGEVNLGEFI